MKRNKDGKKFVIKEFRGIEPSEMDFMKESAYKFEGLRHSNIVKCEDAWFNDDELLCLVTACHWAIDYCIFNNPSA